VAVSKAARDYNCTPLGIHEDEVAVIPNGVDTGEFFPSDSQPRHACLRIGVAARLVPEKGLGPLLEAFARLGEDGLEAELLIAGDGTLLSSLQEQAAALGRSRSVHFLGLVQNMGHFWRSVDVAVLPSIAAEGLPLTILEAMATGLPVVATRVAGAPEVIQDASNGVLVPPGDVSALVDALRRAARDPQWRRALGRSALQTVREHFSMDAISRRIGAIYARRSRA
jgi:glycosyltransferase involved in cell wall biosynthesis